MTDPKEVLELSKKIPPGPWKYDREEQDAGTKFGLQLVFDCVVDTDGDRLLRLYDKALAQFIALSRTAMPDLAQRVIELEEELSVLKEAWGGKKVANWTLEALRLQDENAKLRAVVEGGKISLRHCLPDPDEDEECVTCDGYPDACHQCSAGKLREALIALTSAGYGGDNL
jgi:hypothetical protein